MGFCRRCGEIVVGPRCKCGGTAVAPVVPWTQLNQRDQNQDRWSKTYVARDKSPTRTPSINNATPVVAHATGSKAGSPTKRFPRPIPTVGSSVVPISSRVTAHIATSTAHSSRPPSPLKQSITALPEPTPESDILPSPHASTLAKVYGSVLQPKETLTMHSCAICNAPFLPDSTIYPDPSEPTGTRFLCRPCFAANGGSKGTCAACGRPVLALKSEGTFVTAADKFWHKKCFVCDGCNKLIGDAPMVDLLGKPSCVECFDNCLKRDATTPKKKWGSPNGDKASNLGGLKSGKSREGSPAIEELEQRLGITKSRENSPILEELSNTFRMVGRNTVHDDRNNLGSPLSSSLVCRADPLPAGGLKQSPLRGFHSPSSREDGDSQTRITPLRYPSPTSAPKPTPESVESMKNRFLKSGSSSPAPSPSRSLANSSGSPRPLTSKIPVATSTSRQSPSLRRPTAPSDADKKLVNVRRQDDSPIPDLMSDNSDTTTQSSGPDSPPRNEDDVDVFEDQGTIRGRGRSKSTALPWGGHRKGDYLSNTDLTLPVPGLVAGQTYNTPKLAPSLTTGSLPYVDIPTVPPSATCARCNGPLFSLHSNAIGGRFVTVPGDSRSGVKEPKMYHPDCFRCIVCDGTFKETENGKAVFVRGEQGASHVECAKPKTIIIKSKPSPEAKPTPPSHPQASLAQTHSTSSRFEQPPMTAPPISSSMSFPRFGGGASCPGCCKAVSPMERGVVPGPQGTRWHAGCLVCGGRKAVIPTASWRLKEGRNKGEPGCGKKLDSAAKSDSEGGIWCRECLLLLPTGMRSSPHHSPTRSGLVPALTGNATTPVHVVPQLTGMTTLARQFTGLNTGDSGLLRQLTGGGLSPTRQLGSPTKGLLDRGQPKQVRERPRPKSVIGMRGRSIDEGRGMYLVRQMTGGAAG